MKSFIEEKVTFITSEELLQKYPGLSPKERENAVCKECGTVFITQIGKKPVSYTHLDVYKRQEQHFRVSMGFKHMTLLRCL